MEPTNELNLFVGILNEVNETIKNLIRWHGACRFKKRYSTTDTDFVLTNRILQLEKVQRVVIDKAIKTYVDKEFNLTTELNRLNSCE